MKAAFLVTLLVVMACAPATVAQRRPAPVNTAKVVATFPHDARAFTQGLIVSPGPRGEFYESTGLFGESSLRRVEIATGRVLQEIKVSEKYFAEGLALVGDELLQLTWQSHVGFVYDRQTFKQKRTFPYKTEGWGLAYDGGTRLVMSDGTDTLSFLDPKTLAVTGTIRVRDAGRVINQLNELEFIEGEIWANVWMTDRIARISPATGEVSSWIDLASLWPVTERPSPGEQVLNGIAYDKATRRIYVTGKKWPRVFQITVP